MEQEDLKFQCLKLAASLILNNENGGIEYPDADKVLEDAKKFYDFAKQEK